MTNGRGSVDLGKEDEPGTGVQSMGKRYEGGKMTKNETDFPMDSLGQYRSDT